MIECFFPCPNARRHLGKGGGGGKVYRWKSSSIPQVVLEVGWKPAEGIWYDDRRFGRKEEEIHLSTCAFSEGGEQKE